MGVDEFGYDQWNTTRTEMGELVYRLKYQNDKTSIAKIVDLLGKYKGLETMDAIVPIPSTNKQRPIKPVCEIARELGKRVGVPVKLDALEKSHGGKELKNIDDPEEIEIVRDLERIVQNARKDGVTFGFIGYRRAA